MITCVINVFIIVGVIMSFKDSILSKSNQFNYYKDKTVELNKENKKLKNEISLLSPDLEDGISLIIPSYKGESYIRFLLDSLENQTLSRDLFEIIFIVNGEMDSTMDILSDFSKSNTDMHIIFTYTSEAGASNARNIGIRIASREYIGFIDDDDFISENYLESLYKYRAPNRVVMSNFIDINEETREEMESRLVPFSMNKSGIIKGAPVKLIDLAVVTHAKILPTKAIKRCDFNTDLTNGEDISYYAKLYPKNHFEFYFVDKKEKAIYYRVRRSGSISRQEYSFKFNVLQRLMVLDDVNESYKSLDKEDKLYREFLRTIFGGQSQFMKRYLNEVPEDREKVIDEVKKHDFVYFPYERLDVD